VPDGRWIIDIPLVRHLRRLALPLLLSACAHTEPIGEGTIGSGGPFAPGNPLRLTFSEGQDLEPAWLANDAGILYAFEPADHPDADRCLGVLPPGGGTRRAQKCVTSDISHLLTNALRSPAVGPGGILAWVEARNRAGLRAPEESSIRVGSFALADTGRIARPLPYFAPSNQVHTTATHLGWLGPDTLVYIGAEVLFTRACSTCKLDSLVTGRDVVLLDLADPAGTPIVVPGTTSASSVIPSDDRTALYYTLGGDTHVYRRTLAGGAVSTVVDFDTLGIARDVTVRDSVVFAIVGGRVSYNTNPLFDRLQTDSGGLLVRQDLVSGLRTVLSDTAHYFRHPRLSFDGRVLVAEGTDNFGSPVPDLYLLTNP
jgi:hypothetical protein